MNDTFDQDECIEMRRLEDKYTKRPSVWEVSQSFPDCRDIAHRIVDELSPLFADEKDVVVIEFMKIYPEYKVLEQAKKFLGFTKPKPQSHNKQLDIQSAKRVPIQSLYEFEGVRRTSVRTFAKCPFHTEKSGSFVVYHESNSFHCFGCQVRGSSVDFVMKLHNLDFKSAVLTLTGVL